MTRPRERVSPSILALTTSFRDSNEDSDGDSDFAAMAARAEKSGGIMFLLILVGMHDVWGEFICTIS